jgi:hypothetical protein
MPNPHLGKSCLWQLGEGLVQGLQPPGALDRAGRDLDLDCATSRHIPFPHGVIALFARLA